MLFVFALYLPFSLLKSNSFNRPKKTFNSYWGCLVNWHVVLSIDWGSAKEEQCEKRNPCGQKSQRGGFESSLWDLKDDRLPAGVCNAILTTLKKTGNSKLTFLGFSYFLRNSSHTQKINKKILLVLQSLLNIS